MLLFKKFWVFPALFFLLLSCRKPTSANWDVDVVLPVVNSTLNIKNFIGDSIFNTDHNGVLNLSIKRDLVTIKLDSLLKLPDTTIVLPRFISPLTTTLQPGSALTFFAPAELKFDISNGVELRRIDVHSGSMTVKYSNDVAQPLDLIYSIPNATRYGLPLKITETVPTGTNSLIKTYDLSGYSLNMTGLNGNVYNTIVQTYTVSVNPNSAPVLVQAGQGAQIEVNYSGITPQYLEGYFGQQDVTIDPDTAMISFVKNVKAGNFMLSDATMNFSIVNEIGAEFRGNLSNIKSINSPQHTSVSLISNQFSNINIDAATKSGTTVFPKIKPITLNTANSNVTAFISNLPDALTYQGNISLNPNGDLSGHNNFAFYNTGIKIIADITVPLRFTANYFQLTSATPANFTNVKQLDNVNSGNFIISASNGYPLDAKFQAYLLDDSGTVIDSLFNINANTLEKGQINSLNEVVFPTRSRILIPITKNKIASLKRTKSIKIISLFTLPPNPPEIKIYESYVFDINIIAELNYNVGIN